MDAHHLKNEHSGERGSQNLINLIIRSPALVDCMFLMQDNTIAKQARRVLLFGLKSTLAPVSPMTKDILSDLNHVYEAQGLSDWLRLPTMPISVSADVGTESKTLVEKLVTTLEGFKPSSVAKSAEKLLDSGEKIIKKLIVGLVFLSCAYKAINSKSPKWFGAATLAALMLDYIDDGASKTIVNAVMEMIKTQSVKALRKGQSLFSLSSTDSVLPKEDFDPNVGQDFVQMETVYAAEGMEDFSSGFLTLAFSLFSMLCLAKTPPNKVVEKFMETVPKFPRVMDGIGPILAALSDLCVNAINAIYSWFTGSEGPWIPKTSDVKEVDDWAEAVLQFKEEFSYENFLYTPENQQRVEALLTRGYELMKMDMTGLAIHRLRRFVSEYMRLLRTMLEKIKDLTPERASFRPQPICIVIRGLPATGKTWLAQQLLARILALTLPPEQWPALQNDWKQFVYMRTPENKYFEKYKGEFCTIIDDFGQLRDTPGGDVQEWMEIIRMVNNFPYIVHMADIESKGNTFFRSRLVLLTTNLSEQHGPNTINSKEAVLRRMTFDITSGIAEEYARENANGCIPADRKQRSIDPSKLKTKGFEPRVYELEVVQKSKGSNKEILDIDTLAERIAEAMQKEGSLSDDYVDSLDATIRSILKKRTPVCGVYDPSKDPAFTYDAEGLDMDCPLDFGSVNPVRLEFECDPVRHAMSGLTANFKRALKELDIPFSTMHIIRRMMEDRSHGLRSDEAALLAILQTLSCLDNDHFGEAGLNRFCDDLFEWKAQHQDLPVNVRLIITEIVRTWITPGRIDELWLNVEEHMRLQLDRSLVFERKTWKTTILDFTEKHVMWMNDNPTCKILLGLVGWIGIVAAAMKVYRVISEWGSEDSKPGAADTKVFTAEGEPDANGTQIGVKVAHRNLYSFHWKEDGAVAGYVIVLSGRVGIMPHHYKTIAQYNIENGAEPDQVCFLKSVKTGVKHKLPLSDLLRLEQTEKLKSQDVGVLKLPLTMHSHPDIVRNWVTEDQLRPFASVKVGLWRNHEGDLLRDSGLATIRLTKPAMVQCKNSQYEVTRVLDYPDIETASGYCGAPLVANMASFGPGKILGFHIAGHATAGGLGSLVTREQLEEIFELPSFKDPLAAPVALEDAIGEDEVNPHRIKLTYEAQMTAPYNAPAPIYGEVERDKAPYLPRETSIRKSPLYELWGPAKTAPADLTNKEFCRTAILKFFREPNLEIGLGSIERACQEYAMKIIAHKNRRRRASLVFDFETACIGSPAVQYCESIPRNTSAGYPHNVARSKLTGKKRFFGTAEAYDLSGNEAIALRKRVEKIINLAKEGKRSLHIYTDVFKDERLPIGKNKIRAFSASPLELTIAIRMYFMDFTMFMMEENVGLYCGPGMNPNSVHWDRLVNNLLDKSDKIIAGDYSAFDSRHMASIMRFLLIIIEAFYDSNEEDKRIRRVLFEEVVNSIHILGRKVYQWSGSLPSGSALTTFVNCLLNIIYMMMAFVNLVKGSRFEDFFTKVYLCVFGDDNILSVHDSICEEFNGVTIQGFMPKLNQEYTSEDKSSTMYKYKKITEASFLKRGMRWEPILNRWVAPLSINSIDEAPYWYRKTPDPAQTINSTIDWMFMEYSLHGKEVFQRIVAERKSLVAGRIGYESPLALDWFTTLSKAVERTDYF